MISTVRTIWNRFPWQPVLCCCIFSCRCQRTRMRLMNCSVIWTAQSQSKRSECCGKNSLPYLISVREGKIRLATPLWEHGLRALPLSELGYQQPLTLSRADLSFWRGLSGGYRLSEPQYSWVWAKNTKIILSSWSRQYFQRNILRSETTVHVWLFY